MPPILNRRRPGVPAADVEKGVLARVGGIEEIGITLTIVLKVKIAVRGLYIGATSCISDKSRTPIVIDRHILIGTEIEPVRIGVDIDIILRDYLERDG